MQRNFSPKRRHAATSGIQKSRLGQAIIEYCLLLAFVTLIFGSLFSVIRRSVFYFWICDVYPRVASIHSCDDPKDCMAAVGDSYDPNCPATFPQ